MFAGRRVFLPCSQASVIEYLYKHFSLDNLNDFITIKIHTHLLEDHDLRVNRISVYDLQEKDKISLETTSADSVCVCRTADREKHVIPGMPSRPSVPSRPSNPSWPGIPYNKKILFLNHKCIENSYNKY